MSDRSAHILVTGVAASTCCGVGVAPFFARLERNLSSNGAPSKGDRYRFPPITTDISEYVRITRTENELTRQLLAAVAADLTQTIEALEASDRERLGVVIGNTSGNYAAYRQFYMAGLNLGYSRVNPAHLPGTLINYQAVQLSNALGIKGQSTTLSSGSSCGLDAVGHAATRLRLGKDESMLAGGIQEISEYDRRFLQSRQLVSPTGCVRPYDAARDGTVPGEAVGLLLLSRDRGHGDGQGLAEILGWASTVGGPTGEPTARSAIEEALGMARLQPQDIDAVFSSANGTTAGDEMELVVLRQIFGDRLGSVAVYAIKSVVGECFAASGPLQCIAAVHAINHGKLSPDRDPGSSTGSLPAVRLGRCTRALVLCVGLDHTYAAMVLGRTRQQGSG